MIQDPNVERLIRKSIEPLNKQISMLQIELEGLKKQLAIPRVTTRTFRFSGIRNARKFVREIQAIDRESAIADFELTYPDLTWRTTTELD